MAFLIGEKEFRSIVGPKQEVTRDRYQDSASSHTICKDDLLRTEKYLTAENIQCGKKVLVKEGVDIKICKPSMVVIGDRCIFCENSTLLFTMPGPRIIIGDWVILGNYSIIAAKHEIVIGSYTIIGAFCQIIDHNHGMGADNLILNQTSELGSTKIGQDCWLGAGVKVLKDVTIGDGSVIGAGSVVTKSIPPYEIWAGVPAKFIRKRE